MYLRQICNLLSKKPQCMDVMLQFTSPASILQPLCQFLDDWHYDNDQGKFNPILISSCTYSPRRTSTCVR